MSDDLDSCFAGFEDVGPLLLAVSGGPDSMALMHLAARWASRRVPPALYVATVDHRLRPASRGEADMVAGAAAGLGLPHAILTWEGRKPMSRLQEKARESRHALLGGHARQIGASHILTAHHADDQAETVLMRLGHGSGIGGLAGMLRVAPLGPGLWLGRPLLGQTKAELVAFCRANSIPYIEDPSNHDLAFARARLREHAVLLARLGLDTCGLNRLARRMARADTALEAETERVERALRPSRTAEAFTVDLASTRDIAPEIALRLLRRAVASVAGEGRAIRLERLEALADAVWAALRTGAPHRATLAGTRVVVAADGRLAVAREPRRRRGRTPPAGVADRPD